MSRTIAREIAMKLAFSHLLGGGGDYGELLELSGYDSEPTVDDVKFALSIVSGVEKVKDELDHYIGECSQGWSVDRMPGVDLCILRTAAYEFIYYESKAGEVINDAVDLAKQFGGDRSPRFVNGVLGGMFRAYKKGLIVPFGIEKQAEPAGE